MESVSSLPETANFASRIKLAENKSTPATILGVLSYSADERIRAAIADNPSAPLITLLKLSRDKSADIRYQLAENHNLPIQVLVTDENPYVSSRAVSTLKRLEVVDYAATSRFPISGCNTFISQRISPDLRKWN